MKITTLEEAERSDLCALIKEVLSDKYSEFLVHSISFKEDFGKNLGEIECHYSNGESEEFIKKEGHGLVDALFDALLEKYSESCPSLKNIQFMGFEVAPDFKETKTSGSDANISVTIKLTNSSKRTVSFRNKSRSVVAASVVGIFQAIEFYINSEKAFRRLKFLIKEAQSRGRSDIASRYVYKISKIVNVTSYEEIE